MDHTNSTPNWLQNLQHNSWHAEIILSGLILFSLTRAPGAMDKFYLYMVQEFGIPGGYSVALVLVETGIIWLIIGFISHLTIRGSWIGLVGLSYIFPQGIKHDNLPYHRKFLRRFIDKPTLTQLAIRVDQIASGVFSISFYFFMSTVGLTLSGIVLGVVGYYAVKLTIGEYDNASLGFHAMIMIVIYLPYFIDFLSLGALKRSKWFHFIYYPIYRLMSTLMLASFYRHIYYAFVSNIKKWKIGLGVFFYFAFSVFLFIMVAGTRRSDNSAFSAIDFYARDNEYAIYHGSYENLNEGKFSRKAHIQSDIISGNTVRLFVVHGVNQEEKIKAFCNFDENLEGKSRDSAGIACMDQYYRLFLNDSLKDHTSWRYHEKQVNKQKGISCWVDVADLARGEHILEVRIANDSSANVHAYIPFYKE